MILVDVVIAHKKLMTEKTRLEETLKTVTDVKSTNVDGDPVTDNNAEVFCCESTTQLTFYLTNLLPV